MPLFLALMIFMMSFLPASNAETLDKNKFLAPGSQKTDLRAPENDSSKTPGVLNPADGPTVPGTKLPIAPVNDTCPINYHCDVSNGPGNYRCLPNRQNISIIGPESCFNIARLCKIYRDAIAAGRALDESDAEKNAYYCN